MKSNTSTNSKSEIVEAIRSKVVRNGRRGTTLKTLVATARTVKSTANRTTVKNILNKLTAYEVKPEVYSLAN
jgi:hypothetical protein